MLRGEREGETKMRTNGEDESENAKDGVELRRGEESENDSSFSGFEVCD